MLHWLPPELFHRLLAAYLRREEIDRLQKTCRKFRKHIRRNNEFLPIVELKLDIALSRSLLGIETTYKFFRNSLGNNAGALATMSGNSQICARVFIDILDRGLVSGGPLDTFRILRPYFFGRKVCTLVFYAKDDPDEV